VKIDKIINKICTQSKTSRMQSQLLLYITLTLYGQEHATGTNRSTSNSRLLLWKIPNCN